MKNFENDKMSILGNGMDYPILFLSETYTVYKFK